MSRFTKVSSYIGTDFIWQSSIKVPSNLFSGETMTFLSGIITSWRDLKKLEGPDIALSTKRSQQSFGSTQQRFPQKSASPIQRYSQGAIL